MTITIPVWLLWILGIVLGIRVLSLLVLLCVMGFLMWKDG